MRLNNSLCPLLEPDQIMRDGPSQAGANKNQGNCRRERPTPLSPHSSLLSRLRRCRLGLPPRFVGYIWHVYSHLRQLFYCLHHHKLLLYRGHHKLRSFPAHILHNNQISSSHPQTRLTIRLTYPRIIRNFHILILNGDCVHPREPHV